GGPHRRRWSARNELWASRRHVQPRSRARATDPEKPPQAPAGVSSEGLQFHAVGPQNTEISCKTRGRRASRVLSASSRCWTALSTRTLAPRIVSMEPRLHRYDSVRIAPAASPPRQLPENSRQLVGRCAETP